MEHDQPEVIFERVVLNGYAKFRVVRAARGWHVEYVADWLPDGVDIQAQHDSAEAAIADCNGRAMTFEVTWSTYLGHVLEGDR